ncbi:hypothetical protein [Alteromonas sp. a30]|uniref:hypothetical protein n=1 Tax=Alteromonas sp. a30 TaxID=2730917 RepID=UPI002280FC75|nr:hypothetical protein [Alteromonas sp. a30]MCY7293938.1 hypothetical protein [Alteromonas sp. a30]
MSLFRNWKAFSALSFLVVSAPSVGDVTTGNVNVTAFASLNFVEDLVVNFGQIPPSVGATCVMDNAGAVTGPCTNVGSVQQAGQITVSGLAASSNVLVTITGENDNSEVDFLAAAELEMNSGNAGVEATLADGVQSAPLATTAGTAEDIVATVYGTLDVATALTGGQNYSTTYTLDVTYQ